MGLILDIVDKVVPRIIERQANEGGNLKDIIEEELQKEVGQPVTKKKHIT
ncbi:MAG: hypothetical protein ACRC68_18355 [Clostridium sp.]